MKERPILFSGPMVRAILSGAKTQTRRVVKGVALEWLAEGFTPEFVASPDNYVCPYGQSCDRLWVRETFWQPRDKSETLFKADGAILGCGKWKPSIHMPRWASRITLEIVSVRVERLNDISEQDARAEGAPPLDATGYRGGFFHLWQSINGHDSLDANPWVWVVEFRRLP